jgi:hydrogenase expression/formation protein HypC
MCLAIPGEVLSSEEREGRRVGRVQFGGVIREVCFDFVPEVVVGNYVMVHVGFAISVVDKDEAERTYAILKEMGMAEEGLPWSEPSPGN